MSATLFFTGRQSVYTGLTRVDLGSFHRQFTWHVNTSRQRFGTRQLAVFLTSIFTHERHPANFFRRLFHFLQVMLTQFRTRVDMEREENGRNINSLLNTVRHIVGRQFFICHMVGDFACYRLINKNFNNVRHRRRNFSQL